jgi:hypothetical protein
VNISQLKAIPPWLADANDVWICAGVLGIALIVAFRPGTCEPIIRIVGLVLQMLGLGAVVVGIAKTRALFKLPSLLAKAKAWARRCPFRKPATQTISGAGIAVGTAFGKGSAYGKSKPGQNPSTDDRLDALEKNVDNIHARITSIEVDLNSELQKSASALLRESQARQADDQEIRKKLEETSAGGLHISAIGTAWLFVGVFLSTAAPELAALLK